MILTLTQRMDVVFIPCICICCTIGKMLNFDVDAMQMLMVTVNRPHNTSWVFLFWIRKFVLFNQLDNKKF